MNVNNMTSVINSLRARTDLGETTIHSILLDILIDEMGGDISPLTDDMVELAFKYSSLD